MNVLGKVGSFHIQDTMDTRTDSSIVVYVISGLKLKHLSVNVVEID
jgi:hypothetical protein